VVDVERLRVAWSGPTHFIDAIAEVPRTYPIDPVEAIKRTAQEAVSKALGDAELTFTAVPVARDNESVRERIMVIARNSGLAVHHVTVHDLGGKLTVSIDLEVDGEMALIAAHDIAQELERCDPRGFWRGRRGRHPYRAAGTGTAPWHGCITQTGGDHQGRQLTGFAANGAIHDIQNVRVRDTDAGEIVNFHCRAAPSMSVIKVHENVDEIERALRRAFPHHQARHQPRRAALCLSML
jgi:divalent metal cation (Fe/Co/Zn/Cd) transporter